jgi:hypothetical protein
MRDGKSRFRSASVLLSKPIRHFPVTVPNGMIERRQALPVTQRSIRSSPEQRVEHCKMIRAAIAKDYSFHYGGPVQVVDVIKRRTGIYQALDDVHVAQMSRRNQRRAFIRAGYEPRIVSKCDGKRHQFGVIGNRGDCHRIICLTLKGVYVRAGFGERAQRIVFGGEGCNMDWCPTSRIAAAITTNGATT